MKSSELAGFSQVFKFTLTQTIKQKSYFISLLIMILCSIAVFPVMRLMNNREKSSDSIEKVYFINDTNMTDIPITEALSEEIPVEVSGIGKDALLKSIVDHEENAVALEATVDLETGGYILNFYYDTASDVDGDDVYNYAEKVANWFVDYKLLILEIDENILDDLTREIVVNQVDYEDFVKEDETVIITEGEYNVIYAFLMIFYMVIILASSAVANKVVEEKANRIVEYLMTTVRPMALMLGKIVAMLVSTVGQIVLILLTGFCSYKITGSVNSRAGVMSNFISFDAVKGLNLASVIACILIMIIGIVMYGLIAGLFGASVSKMEEVQQGLKTFTMIILIAFFASMISANLMWTMGINGYVKFTMFFPITSVMILPGIIMTGQATVIEILISIAIMLVTSVIILWFVSLIYESVIVMTGAPIKFSAMMKLAKGTLHNTKEVSSNEK